jgi:hypothetical protein
VPVIFGTPLDILVEGLLDKALGVITDGFLIEVDEEEPVPSPPGGSMPILPRRVIIVDWRRRKRRREDDEILELLS